VFPSEQYGLSGNDRKVVAQDCKPTEATTSIQSGWKHAKKRSGVRVRLHDLRHTACTRLLEGGIPLTVVGSILGWAGSTMVLMAKRYGHIGQQAKQDALAVLDRVGAPQKTTDTEPQTTPPPAAEALDAQPAIGTDTVN
jgi:integrase